MPETLLFTATWFDGREIKFRPITDDDYRALGEFQVFHRLTPGTMGVVTHALKTLSMLSVEIDGQPGALDFGAREIASVVMAEIDRQYRHYSAGFA